MKSIYEFDTTLIFGWNGKILAENQDEAEDIIRHMFDNGEIFHGLKKYDGHDGINIYLEGVAKADHVIVPDGTKAIYNGIEGIIWENDSEDTHCLENVNYRFIAYENMDYEGSWHDVDVALLRDEFEII